MVCKDNRKLESHSKSNLSGSVRQNKSTNLKKTNNNKPKPLPINTLQGFQYCITAICALYHSTEPFIMFNIWISIQSYQQLQIRCPKHKARA